MIEKNYVISGRNTIIHKVKKIDLLILNGDHPVVQVTHHGLTEYTGIVPAKKVEAKKNYQEVIDLSSMDVFGEEKKLLFVQALDNKEYKVDYTKVNTPNFIRVHQDNYM